MNEHQWKVQHNLGQTRFEVLLDDGTGVAEYRLHDGLMQLTHTEVPAALEGRGIASGLMQAAVEHARAQGLKIQPLCSYAAAYMRRHPETHDLLV